MARSRGEFANSPTSGAVVSGQRADLQVVYGQQTQVAAVDTIVTGLSYVLMAMAVLNDDPSATTTEQAYATADVGDQAGTPAAGSFLLNAWQDDFVSAAGTFGAKVNWIAIGY